MLPNGKFLYYNHNYYYGDDSVAQQIALQSTVQAIQNIVNTAYTSSNKPYIIGQYYGTNLEKNTITCGFRPSAVLLMPRDSLLFDIGNTIQIFGGLATSSSNVNSGGVSALVITNTGFEVYYKNASVYYAETNKSGKMYHYIAFK